MQIRRTTAVILRLALAATLFAGVAVLALTQDLPTTLTAGMELTDEQTTALLKKVKARLDTVNQPSGWIDDLLEDLPAVTFDDDIGDNQALYQPTGQGLFGRSGNTLYLRTNLDLNNLSPDQLGLIAHEVWHAWFDFIPWYIPVIGSSSGSLSGVQDEAVGGFVQQLVAGQTLGDAVAKAITEAEIRNAETPAQDAVDAIAIIERRFDTSFFAHGLPTDVDVARWANVRRNYPPVQALEQYFSQTDRQRIDAYIAESARINALTRGWPADDPRWALLASGPTLPVETEPDGASAPPAGAGAATGAPTPAPESGPPVPSGASAPLESFPEFELAPDPTPAATVDPAPVEEVPEAVPIPDCTVCIPIAEKLREAVRQLEALQAESETVDRRLGEIPQNLKQAEQQRNDLQAEYDERLAETRVRSGDVEAGYYEVGSTVYIGTGTTTNGTFVPDEVPDPNAPRDLGNSSGPRPSPYMSRLKSRIEAVESTIASLENEAADLAARRKQLDAEVAAARAAVDTLKQELEECLKTCGQVGSLTIRLTVASSGVSPPGGGAGNGLPSISIYSGNPTDLLSGLNIYALPTAGGIPTTIARPDAPVDDRYQLFIVPFIRAGSRPGQAPATTTSPGSGQSRGSVPPWAGIAQTAYRWLSAGVNLLLPRPVHARTSRPFFAAAGLAPGAAGQDASIPAMSIVATGLSSGDALQLEMPDTGGLEILAPDGLVLQAVRQGALNRIDASAGPLVTTVVTGFCLEYGKPPPPAGMLYQVAPDAVQQRYQSMRPVIDAGRALADANLLTPDSDPVSYATFIRQWALWTQLEGWDQAEFTREFLSRTRKNVEEAGRSFTSQMQEALQGAAPHRFNDILAVLVEAEGVRPSLRSR